MSGDILDRAFGPEPAHPEFPPVNPEKIIPFHDCVYTERTVPGMWGGVVRIEQCEICRGPRPAPPREEP